MTQTDGPRRNLPSDLSRIAVIGAGMSGLACAARLAEAGLQVIVYEKSRGVGGRIATRRTPENLQFDHGAQYFTAASPAFQDFTSDQLLAGNLEHWWPDGRPETARAGWLVGRPSMNAFLKPIARHLTVELKTRVADIAPEKGGWRLSFDERNDTEHFSAVIVTAPAPPAQALTTASPLLQKRLDGIRIAPCWALMLAVSSSDEAWPAVLADPHPDIAWMARNSSKPGRAPLPDTWVVHASPEFSDRYLEGEPDAIAAQLKKTALPLAGHQDSQVVYAKAHRWRYARTLQAAGTPFLSDETGTLIAAGDWCLGARVESAFESGRAAAEFMIGKLPSA